MDQSLLTKLEILRTAAPMPWYLDQDNNEGICVKDSTGETVFYEDYGCVPDEHPNRSELLDAVVNRARALGRFLVEWSGTARAACTECGSIAGNGMGPWGACGTCKGATWPRHTRARQEFEAAKAANAEAEQQ